MKVRLQQLDKVTSFKYTPESEIRLFSGKGYEVIGSCKLFTENGKEHFGELTLNTNVDTSLFFYYASLNNENGDFWFDGLNLMKEQQTGKPTAQLKDIVVS